MKFARFEYEGKRHSGIVVDDEIRPVEGSIFDRYEETGERLSLTQVRLLPPVTPTKIVCIGQNYPGHIEELGVPIPEKPLIFFKPPSCLIGHDEDIVYPPEAERVDYEGEMAVIIKDEMKNVPEEEALRYVLGCSCFNDVTERALVVKDPLMLSLSKGMDTFGPCGPYVVAGLDPNNLGVTTYLNGEIVQQDHTKDFVFSLQYLLHYISRFITLYPGDVVSTGTPKGISPMVPGDVVEVEVEGVGRLRNKVIASG